MMKKVLSGVGFLSALMWSAVSFAACPTGNPQTMEAYIFGCPTISSSLSSGAVIPYVPSSTTAPTSSMQGVPANIFMTLADPQTPTNKTISCASNTCTNIPTSALSGTLLVAQFNSALVSSVLDLIGATQGGIIYRGPSTWNYLAPGTSGQFLETLGAGANPLWATVGGGGGTPGGANTNVQFNNSGSFGGSTGLDLSTTKVLSMSIGLGSDATGDIYYNGGSGTFTRLGVGTNGQVLTLVSGLPAWQNASGGTSFSALTSGTNTTAAMLVGTGASLVSSGSGTIAATSLTAAGFANPSATIGTAAINGTATTAMRSDAAPAIPQCSSSTFGACKVDGTTITASAGVITATAAGAFSATLSPGLTTAPTTYNPGTQTLVNGQTLSNQLFYDGHASSCTINSTCGAANDAGKLITATATGVTFTTPAPGAVGTAVYNFGVDANNDTYLIHTPSGTIYGCGTSGATTPLLGVAVSITPDGTNWQCTAYGPTNSIFPFSWGPNQNLATTAIPLLVRGVATTVTGAACDIGPTPVTGTATVVLTHSASGVSPAVGTNPIATCNAAGTANTSQTLSLTNTVVPAGDIIWVIGAGSGWAGTITSISGKIQIALAP